MAAPRPDGLTPRARRMREDWCGYGLQEAHKEEQQREARQIRDTADEAAEDTGEAELLMAQAREQVLAFWISVLRDRKDLRSQAIADYLAGDTPSRAHLQDLARRSTDPMVTALALQRPCKGQACTAVDKAQWARLEPDNLMAWMAQTGTEQTAYLIERMGREAQRSEDYLLPLSQALAELSVATTPGLRQMAELELMAGVLASWNLPAMRPVLDGCQAARTQPAMATHCERIAQLMWGSSHLLGRGLALALARRLVPPTHDQRPEWERRALRYEALVQAEMDRSQAQAERWAHRLPQEGCRVAAFDHAELRKRMRLGEWAFAQDFQAASGDSLEVLALRNRASRDGRSLLDSPVPASAAAPSGR
ncbi:hypothetical protein H5407_19315 [Mitsuaria sp. WAJ17]|uniref:hypothetical protein n=1 Tax=Mitsuaria sp. WAJ17 TaxID=2761452 RepID=UPI001600E0FD|nr:hypothetical protein [Mitsuaria sp. WAJ17]MBB2487391.1 hypothetical protein [Mitsuaria sp. WAJ17]